MGTMATQGQSQAHGATHKPPVLFNFVLTSITRLTTDDPFVDPPPGGQPISYLYPTEGPPECVTTP
jgi:hypothetical protein